MAKRIELLSGQSPIFLCSVYHNTVSVIACVLVSPLCAVPANRVRVEVEQGRELVSFPCGTAGETEFIPLLPSVFFSSCIQILVL